MPKTVEAQGQFELNNGTPASESESGACHVLAREICLGERAHTRLTCSARVCTMQRFHEIASREDGAKFSPPIRAL